MVKKSSKSKIFNTKQILAFVALIAIAVGLTVLYLGYSAVFKPNINLEEEHTHIYIPTGSTYDDVKRIITEMEILRNPETFFWLARQKNYPNLVRAGRYRVERGMSNNRLVNILRGGRQAPVRVTFNNIRTKPQLAGALSRNLEADSLQILEMLNNAEIAANFGFDLFTINLMFIPNTYEFFWNTSAEQLFERMHVEYQRFWTEERTNKAIQSGLTPIEIGILASIIRLETRKRDEMPRMAGVYINRLRRNIPLQADPTVVFAIGDFSIRRVLRRHLAFESPFNTYLNTGLPPGPISLPEPYVIDAVLNYEQHNYLFFAAHYDFSGYHIFARTYAEHRENARRYHRELNARNIMR
ncbi:MAG TPA: endolytic transglycosylase MltG [Bacteroidales bacterium]|nr:endolytic transglycosylase MltG [Bacteroidales bacterium]